MILQKCDNCDKTAIWMLMSGPGLACDDCVPRGCSCNENLKEGIAWESEEAKDPKNYIQDTDEKGRLLPCCEWFYYPEGVMLMDTIEEYMEAAGYKQVLPNGS